MKTKRKVVLLVLSSLFFVPVSWAQNQGEFKPYTADAVFTSQRELPPNAPDAKPVQLTTKIKQRLYVSKDKDRVEGTVENVLKDMQSGEAISENTNDTGIVINHRDKNVSWTLAPATKTYWENNQADMLNFMNKAMGANAKSLDALVKEVEEKNEFVGTEIIDGQQADKYKLKQGDPSKISYYLHGTKVPLKFVTSKSVTEYKNIKIGEPPAELFEIPQGYTKVDPPPAPEALYKGK